jgi:hypothetical protein
VTSVSGDLEALMADEWTIATLKELLDRELSGRDRAATVALTELNRRLDQLNHAHQAAKEKEAEFFRRDAHDVFALRVSEDLLSIRQSIVTEYQRIEYLHNEDVKRMMDEIDEISRPNWVVWFAAATLLISLTSGVYFLAIGPIQENIEKLDAKLDAHNAMDPTKKPK